MAEENVSQSRKAFMGDKNVVIFQQLGIEDTDGKSLERINSLRIWDFLLQKKQDNTYASGYDTPKICGALIKLARRDFEKQEIFIRVDDDVFPSEDGVVKLKEKYFDLNRKVPRKQFCFSWSYQNPSLRDCQADPEEGQDYPRLFDHYANAYSIRTSFLGDRSCLVRFKSLVDETVRDEGKSLSVQFEPVLDKNTPVKLSIIHNRFFIDLFQLGKWGSDLRDPISGAGMCFCTDSLELLPPWTNAEHLVSWIDDMIKSEMMKILFGSRFDDSACMLSDRYAKGFKQKRHLHHEFSIGNVKWATDNYLDRLLMGCILAFCVNPEKYGSDLKGFTEVLKNKDFRSALNHWELGPSLEWLFCGIEKNACSDPVAHTRISEASFALIEKEMDVFKIDDTAMNKILSKLSGNGSAVAVWECITGLRGNTFAKDDALWSAIDQCLAEKGLERPASISKNDFSAKEKNYLTQWNKKWKVMNLISGHREKIDENSLCCLLREIHEELFNELSPAKLAEMNEALKDEMSYERQAQGRYKDPFVEKAIEVKNPGLYEFTGKDMDVLREKGLSPQGLEALKNLFRNEGSAIEIADVKELTSSLAREWPDSVPENRRISEMILEHFQSRFTHVGFSDSKNEWTLYYLNIYKVELAKDIDQSALKMRLFHEDPFFTPSDRSSPRAVNEWVTKSDIEAGYTALGRPIGRTVDRILRVAGN